MRIAVSGASGLVGAELVRVLSSDEHSISRFIRPNSKSSQSDSLYADNLKWVPETGLLQPELLNNIDAIVHLAGRSIGDGRWTDAERKRLRDSRVAATQRLVDQIVELENPPKTFVSASAIGIYGDQGGDPVDETSAAADSFLADVARDWEAASWPLTERGIRVVHARLGIVLSRHGGALGKVLPLFRFALAGPLGNGRQFWSWVSLTDCVRALQQFATDPSLSGPFNVVAPQAVTNREFTSAVAAAVHRPAIVPAPAWLLRLALGEMADALLLTSCRVIPKRLQQAGFEFQHKTLADFLKEELA